MGNTNKVAVAGGLVILIGGLALAFYTATSTPALKAANERVIKKYVALVDKDLASGDKKGALKAAKAALAVDPTNKLALEAYKKVILADAPKVTAAPAASSAKPAEQPAKSEAPAKPKADEEEEMGCI